MHVDTWRAAYGGIVPEAHLDGLSYDESESLWRSVIAAGKGCVFVAENNGGVFGFASGQPRGRVSEGLEEYEGELQTVYVLPVGQGTGAGRRLVVAVARHFVERGISSMLLWVFADNHSARGFYESLGAVPVAEDGFELGGALLSEVAYGWKNLDALLAGENTGRG